MKHKGFTLLELMVTVAIILMVVALAFPKFMSYRKLVQANTCRENLLMLDSATKACIVANNLQNNAEITLEMLLPSASGNVRKYFIATMPICLAGGEYKYNKATLSWGCTLGGGAAANGGFPHGEGIAE